MEEKLTKEVRKLCFKKKTKRLWCEQKHVPFYLLWFWADVLLVISIS